MRAERKNSSFPNLWKRYKEACSKRKLKCPVKKGATAKQLEAFRKKIGKPLPKWFKEFYSHQNGSGSVTIFDGFYSQMSLAEIAKAKKMLNELESSGLWKQGSMWKNGWIPFLQDAGGNYICIDLDGSLKKPKGSVFERFVSDRKKPKLFDSFEHWFCAHVVLLENSPHSDNQFDLDKYYDSKLVKRIKKAPWGFDLPSSEMKSKSKLLKTRLTKSKTKIKKVKINKKSKLVLQDKSGAVLANLTCAIAGYSVLIITSVGYDEKKKKQKIDDFSSSKEAENFYKEAINRATKEGYKKYPHQWVLMEDEKLIARATKNLIKYV